MDNKTTEQNISGSGPSEQDIGAPSSSMTWYIIGAIVVIALVVAYFILGSPVTDEEITGSQATTEQQTEMPALTSGNNTVDISADLGQIIDTSAELDADAAAVASDLQGL